MNTLHVATDIAQPTNSPYVTGLFTLSGVAMGFLLNWWRDSRKEKSRIRNTVKQIREELRANLQMLPDKRKTIENIVNSLKQNKAIPAESVRFVRCFYAEHFAAMCPFFSELERNSLHVIYEHLRIVDETVQCYDAEATQIVRDARASRDSVSVFAAFAQTHYIKLNDLLNALTTVATLIQKHLAGTPEDVFHTQQKKA